MQQQGPCPPSALRLAAAEPAADAHLHPGELSFDGSQPRPCRLNHFKGSSSLRERNSLFRDHGLKGARVRG
jgi:hypothetical protein